MEHVLLFLFLLNLFLVIHYFYSIIPYIFLFNLLVIIHPINKKITYCLSLYLDKYIDKKVSGLNIKCYY